MSLEIYLIDFELHTHLGLFTDALQWKREEMRMQFIQAERIQSTIRTGHFSLFISFLLPLSVTFQLSSNFSHFMQMNLILRNKQKKATKHIHNSKRTAEPMQMQLTANYVQNTNSSKLSLLFGARNQFTTMHIFKLHGSRV